MNKLITIDDLTDVCGYFNPESETNNGYGCDHPEQEETEDGQGKCLRCSCPVAYPAGDEDVLAAGKSLDDNDGDWMVYLEK